jgi:hypothetical protein
MNIRAQTFGTFRREQCREDSARDRANGAAADSAVLVCTIPYGDANPNVVNGRLLVYIHLAADGWLKVSWDWQSFAITFLFNKVGLR